MRDKLVQLATQLDRLKEHDLANSIDTLTKKLAGMFEAPPKMAEDVFNWAREKYCSRILFNTEIKMGEERNKSEEEHSPEALIEYGLLRNECMKYTHALTRSTYFKNIFDIDATDWKYTGNIKLPEDKQWQMVAEIYLYNEVPPMGGWFDARRMLLRINAPNDVQSVWHLKYYLNEIHDTIVHELQHMGQYMLYFLLGKDVDKEEHFYGGMPGQKLRNLVPGTNVPTQLPTEPNEPDRLLHSLRDEEFYTNLQNNITRLIRYLNTYIPKKYRMEFVKAYIIPGYAPKLSGLSREESTRLHAYIIRSNNLATLLKYEPQKYRKAVSELLKAVRENVDLGDYEGKDLSDFPIPPGATRLYGQPFSQYLHERSIELGKTLSKEQTKELEAQDRWEGVKNYFYPQIVKEYDDFINNLSPQQLLDHKNAVEKSGHGYEYYVTNRWRRSNIQDVKEPKRDEKGRTIVAPHPKLPKKKI